MFSSRDQAEYQELADMHETLAHSTSDDLARKMHTAMAAEYRRKAAAVPTVEIVSQPADNLIKYEVSA